MFGLINSLRFFLYWWWEVSFNACIIPVKKVHMRFYTVDWTLWGYSHQTHTQKGWHINCLYIWPFTLLLSHLIPMNSFLCHPPYNNKTATKVIFNIKSILQRYRAKIIIEITKKQQHKYIKKMMKRKRKKYKYYKRKTPS